MKYKQLLTGAALGVAVLASPAASAGQLTGNVSVVSDYMFRGIEQSGGAAVQGGVDYTLDLGIYTGLWVSSAAISGGNEADIYAGYALKIGDFDLTAGAIYYLYSEDTQFEAPPPSGARDIDYYEGFLGAGFGPVAVKAFYTPEYGLDLQEDEALYASATVKLDLTDTLSFTPQVGFSAGDGIKNTWGDEYLDYSITATKKVGPIKDDLSVSLSVIDTDLDIAPSAATAGIGFRDDPKFVIGLRKGFKI